MADAGSAVYSDFIKSLLDTEEARTNSLQLRGLALISTSGTLVTLLFGIVAVIKSNSSTVPSTAHGPLVVAAVLFATAAIMGIAVNVPLLGRYVKPASLVHSYTSEMWKDSRSDAEMMVAATRVKLYANARKANAFKAVLLIVGGMIEISALLPVVIAVNKIVQVHAVPK
jgi:hypothetical protein